MTTYYAWTNSDYNATIYTDTLTPTEASSFYDSDGNDITSSLICADCGINNITNSTIVWGVGGKDYTIPPTSTVVRMGTYNYNRDLINDIIDTKYISNLSNGTDTYVIRDDEARSELSGKQNTLVSGTNIKTINNNSLLGSGNIIIDTVIPYGESNSAADATQKEVTISSITTLSVGQIIIVKPTITSTVADSTLKLNTFDVYPMRYGANAITTSTDSIVWSANYPSWFRFDGDYWVFLGHGVDNNTTYSAMSVANGVAGTETTTRVMRADRLKQIIQGTTLTGLSTSTNSAVAATDSITIGIGKLQAQVNNKQNIINASNKLSASYVSGLATVATSGSYNDLTNKPTIPTVDQSYSETSTNAQSGVAVKSAIDAAIASVYKPSGSIAFASLPTPSSSNLGNVYNMTDSFTTDSRFVEGSGKSYPAGTNVVIVESSEEPTTFYVNQWTGSGGYVIKQFYLPPLNLTDVSVSDVETGETLLSINTVNSNNIIFNTGYWDYSQNQFVSNGTTETFNRKSANDRVINGEQCYCWATNDVDFDEIYTNTLTPSTSESGYFFDVLAGFIDLSNYQQTSTAVTHTANTAVGNATQPVYINSSGVATSTTYTLNKSVPSDAVFTDTTYNAFTGAGSSTAGTSGLVPAPASGETEKYLKSDGTWSNLTATYDSTTRTLTIS